MRVPKEFKSAKQLIKGLHAADVAAEVKEELTLYTPHTEGAEAKATKILNSHKVTKTSKLADIFANKTTGQYYKVNVNVVEIGPKNVNEWICIVNTKSKKKEQYKVSDIFKKKGDKLPDGMEFYYKFQLFVKDQTDKKDNNMYIVFLCSVEGKGKEFIKLKLGKDKPTEEHYKELKRIYKKLTRPWMTAELMIESVKVAKGQPIFFIVDTELTI